MPGAAFDDADDRVSSIGVIRRKPLLLRIEFKDEPQRHRLFYAIGGRAAVLDVDLGGSLPSPTPDARQIPQRAEPKQPGSVARGAIPQAPGPETRPAATSAPMPTPARRRCEAPPPRPPPRPCRRQCPRPNPRNALPTGRPQLVHETPVYAVAAQVSRREPYVARGLIPSLHTPPALARPRTPKAPAGEQARPPAGQREVNRPMFVRPGKMPASGRRRPRSSPPSARPSWPNRKRPSKSNRSSAA